MAVRIDYDYIEAHVPHGSRVLDLGCGDGTLLAELIARKGVAGCGVEIDEAAVQQCVGRGVPVYHGDMMDGMTMFADGAFDCVLLSQTLQQSIDPEALLNEMLRVGAKAIISFPNFGHWKIRLQLLCRGRAPVTRTLPYQWYDTPNLRVLTVKDFRRFVSDRDLRVVDRAFFSPTYRKVPPFAANLLAASAVYIVEKRTAQEPRMNAD